MYTIKAKQLTAEAFRKYGTYQNLLDNEEMKKNSNLHSAALRRHK